MTNNEDKLKRLNELAEEFKTLYIELFEDIAKDLEVLEILKEKMPIISLIATTKDVYEYESKVSGFKPLGFLEYKLIKEWLENDR